MMKFWPVLGVVLALFVSLGAGCAEGDDFLIGGGGKKATTSPGSSADPNPQPSGSGFVGGIR